MLAAKDTVAGRDVHERRELAVQVGEQIDRDLSEADRAAVERLAGLLVRDSDAAVRRALAESVRHAWRLPPYIASRLAHDAEDIAVPFLEASEVFSEADLRKLVPTLGDTAREAAARRARVPGPVATVLAQTAGERPVAALVANPNADLGEAATVIAERFRDAPDILRGLAARRALSAEAAIGLIDRMAQSAASHLVGRYGLAAVDRPARWARVLAIVDVARAVSPAELPDLVFRLAQRGDLDGELIVEALQAGERELFEIGLSRLSGVPCRLIRAALATHAHDRLAGYAAAAGMTPALRERTRRVLARQRNARLHALVEFVRDGRAAELVEARIEPWLERLVPGVRRGARVARMLRHMRGLDRRRRAAEDGP